MLGEWIKQCIVDSEKQKSNIRWESKTNLKNIEQAYNLVNGWNSEIFQKAEELMTIPFAHYVYELNPGIEIIFPTKNVL